MDTLPATLSEYVAAPPHVQRAVNAWLNRKRDFHASTQHVSAEIVQLADAINARRIGKERANA